MPTESRVVPRQRANIDKRPWPWAPASHGLEAVQKLGGNVCHTIVSTAKSGPILQLTSVQEKLLCLKAYVCVLVVRVLVYVRRYHTGKSGCGLHPGSDMRT